jgi:Ser/Thr protein kinase RdoA (MazF antagonist)
MNPSSPSAELTADIPAFLVREYPDLFDDCVTMVPLGGGMDNLNCVVSNRAGRRFVMRQYRLSTPEEVKQEVALIKNLVKLGFATPPAQRNRENRLLTTFEGRPCALFEYLENTRPAVVGDLEALVPLAHRLHVLTWQFPGPHQRARFTGQIERFRQYVATAPADPRLPELLELITRWERRWAPALEGMKPRLRTACVHHDLNPSNLLVDAAGTMWVIDFDEFIHAPVIVELCGLFHYWCLAEDGSSFDLQRAREIVRLYGALSQLNAEEREALPLMMIGYQLRSCLEVVLRWGAANPDFQLKDCYSFTGLVLFDRMMTDNELTLG